MNGLMATLTLTKEAQLHVGGGQSACLLDTMGRLYRLSDHHRRLLTLHCELAMIGATLFQLETSDPDCKDEPEEVPF
jgi:hypothetical protein